jgi:hypothetical protein
MRSKIVINNNNNNNNNNNIEQVNTANCLFRKRMKAILLSKF